MSFSIIFCFLLLVTNIVCQVRRFNTMDEFVHAQGIVTTPNSLTAHDHHRYLSEWTDFLKSVAAVVVAFTGLLSVMGPCWCFVRCIKNGGKIKKQWFYPKSLSEYRRRHELAKGRIIALDRLGTLHSNLDSSA